MKVVYIQSRGGATELMARLPATTAKRKHGSRAEQSEKGELMAWLASRKITLKDTIL